MKTLLDLLITEKDCIRNIVIADAEIRNLSETETDQEKLKRYWTNRQAEATCELQSVQAEIGQALPYYLSINQKKEK